MKNKSETTAYFVQISDDDYEYWYVEFECPYCKNNNFQEFQEFLDCQGFTWIPPHVWQAKPIRCPKCGKRIQKVDYEFAYQEW